MKSIPFYEHLKTGEKHVGAPESDKTDGQMNVNRQRATKMTRMYSDDRQGWGESRES